MELGCGLTAKNLLIGWIKSWGVVTRQAVILQQGELGFATAQS